MRCNFLVLCDYASQTLNGGPILVGIFRRMQTERLPTKLGTHFIACEVEVDPPEAGRNYVLDLVMSDQDGRVLFTTQLQVSFARRDDGGPSYCYAAGPVSIDAPIERLGLYRFDLMNGQEVLGQVRLDVSH